MKSDLDVYLAEGVHRCKENASSDFDALEWRKVNESRYHILSIMACDILVIPINTVAFGRLLVLVVGFLILIVLIESGNCASPGLWERLAMSGFMG